MEEEFSFKDLYRIIRKHFFTIIIAILGAAVLSIMFMIFFVTPKFESEAQLLVNQQADTTQTAMQTNEIQANIQLINTYRDIITGHSVLSQVNQNISTNYSLTQLKNAISVNQSQNSQAFNVRVTMETPEEAQLILNEVINVFETMVQQVYGDSVASIFILSPASYNPNKVSPSLIMYIVVGVFIGLVLSSIIILIVELMDTTIKDENYLTNLGIIKLGQIYNLSTKELKDTRLGNGMKQSSNRERV